MEELWPAILLAWIAGFVDALGYLALSNVFTAHMSGNSASLGANLGRGDWHEVMTRGVAIPPFIVGIALGVLVENLARQGQKSARLAPAFGLELVFLLVYMCIDHLRGPIAVPSGTPVFFVLVALLALAMGVQSATLRRAGSTKVRTTFISGMLTNMTENGVNYLLSEWRKWSGRPLDETGPGQPFGLLAVKFGLIFFSFLIGGVCGGFGQAAWGSIALLAPMAGLAILIAEQWMHRPRLPEEKPAASSH